MNGTFDLLTLLFLVVAVVAILRLRSVLGRRTGHEKPRAEMARTRSDNVVTLGRSGAKPAGDAKPDAEIEDRLKPYTDPSTPLADGLRAIAAADRTFDSQGFMTGARAAYEMIVTAYAEGDVKTLKPLLARDVMDSFSRAIGEREKAGQTVEFRFVGIEKADLLDAELRERTALVTVKFLSEVISATRDAQGETVEGDAASVREVTDIWTFCRDTTSRDPNWRLLATESAN